MTLVLGLRQAHRQGRAKPELRRVLLASGAVVAVVGVAAVLLHAADGLRHFRLWLEFAHLHETAYPTESSASLKEVGRVLAGAPFLLLAPLGAWHLARRARRARDRAQSCSTSLSSPRRSPDCWRFSFRRLPTPTARCRSCCSVRSSPSRPWGFSLRLCARASPPRRAALRSPGARPAGGLPGGRISQVRRRDFEPGARPPAGGARDPLPYHDAGRLRLRQLGIRILAPPCRRLLPDDRCDDANGAEEGCRAADSRRHPGAAMHGVQG